MIRTKRPQNAWSDKGTEFKGSFKNLFQIKASKHIQQRVNKVRLREEKHSITKNFDL